MSLRSRVVGLLVVVFALYISVDYCIQRFVIYPKFIALEREEAIKNLERGREAISSEIEHLSNLCRDWGAWDDTYLFAQDQNEDYISSNLEASLESWADLNLPLIYVVNTKGEVLWHHILDFEAEKPMRLAAFPKKAFPPDHLLVKHTSTDSVTAGIIMTERDPMLIASRPILTNSQKGPVRGAMIMGRFLDKKTVGKLVEQTRVDLKTWPITDSAIPAESRAALGRITANSPIVLDEYEDSTLLVHSTFLDINGKPALLLRADVPREISQKGAAAVEYAVLSLVAAGLVTMVVLIVMLQRIVIGPVAALKSHVTEVGSTGDLTVSLAMDRTDEIGTLAGEFDKMVKQLAASRAKLLAVSRNAGMADVASGVLHNVGNVLTSMNVSAALATQNVRESRMSGLSKAVGLLQEHGNDLGEFVTNDDRGKQLPGYLSQLADLWKTEQESTMHELQSLSANLDHVNQIIQSQQSLTRAAGAIEPTSLTELGNGALAMMGAAFERHDIKVERDIEETASILLDRGKMLQVLVNLLTNAKDAIKAADHDDRTVTLSIRTLEEGRICLEVTDDGIGIAPEDLTRIFAEGFTTKTDGQGVGLHYSALATKEMGGNITAHSDGPDKGATFTIELPVRTAADSSVA